MFMEGWDMFSTGWVGSLHHIAPEQIDSQAYSGEKRDIWSLGVILFQMVVGRPPFFENDPSALFQRVCVLSLSLPL